MRYRRLSAFALLLAMLAGTAASCTEPPPPPPPPRPNPVIFVHGYGGNAASWPTQTAQFVSAGWRSDELTAISYDFNAFIVRSAPTLARAVDEVLARTGAPLVDIVSYSQGSLVTKQCIIGDAPAGEPDCRGKVAHWMSIAGVDNGTSVELPVAKGTDANEDVQGRTPLIGDLQANWCRLVRQGVRVEVQWSPNDGIVVPATNSKEPPPAVNKQVSGLLNHVTIVKDPTVIDEAIRFFRADPPGSVASDSGAGC